SYTGQTFFGKRNSLSSQMLCGSFCPSRATCSGKLSATADSPQQPAFPCVHVTEVRPQKVSRIALPFQCRLPGIKPKRAASLAGSFQLGSNWYRVLCSSNHLRIEVKNGLSAVGYGLDLPSRSLPRDSRGTPCGR